MNKSCVLLLVGAAAVLGHDTYLMPAKFSVKPGRPLFISIHTGDSFPASEQAADPTRLVTEIRDLRIAGLATHGVIEIAKKGTVSISAQTTPKLSVLPPDKFEAYLREEGLQDVIDARRLKGEASREGRELYTKYAKTLVVSDAPDEGYATPAGLVIEIVPEADPSKLRAGESLPVRVLFKGKPAPNLRVERAFVAAGRNARSVVGRTDRHGRLTIPIDSDGRWRLHAVHMQASTRADADWESYWASLTFEIPPSR